MKKIKMNRIVTTADANSIAHNTLRSGGVDPDAQFFEIGQFVQGKGIYFGTWDAVNLDGLKIGKTFNMFAAPHDISNENGDRLSLRFFDAVSKVSAIKNLLGHNGYVFNDEYHKAEPSLLNDIASNTYKGEWFIPTTDMLIDGLYAHKNTKAFDTTFDENNYMTFSNKTADYWSSTGYGMMKVTRFSDGYTYGSRHKNPALVRPVRLELKK